MKMRHLTWLVYTWISKGQVSDDARKRLEPLTQLFPHLPPYLLLQALNHPEFVSTATTPEEQGAPLVDAILRGGSDLPIDLSELKQAVQQGLAEQQLAVQEGAVNARAERRNIWSEEEMDMSRLKLGKDDSFVSA